MNQAHPNDAGRKRPQATSRVAALVLLIATGLPLAALAQTSTQRPPASQTLDPQSMQPQGGRMEAPIGHRQPRPQDLPENVQRDEGRRSAADEELDKKLQICKGC